MKAALVKPQSVHNIQCVINNPVNTQFPVGINDPELMLRRRTLTLIMFFVVADLQLQTLMDHIPFTSFVTTDLHSTAWFRNCDYHVLFKALICAEAYDSHGAFTEDNMTCL